MATSSEIDLRDGDDSLVRMISDFTRRRSESSRPPRDSQNWAPLSLDGFDQGHLRSRFEYHANEAHLVWVVDVELGGGGKRTRLRYAMTTEDLGDIRQDWPRCAQKLRTYAAVHLRADLHLLLQGYAPVGSSFVTLIDARGWSNRHN